MNIRATCLMTLLASALTAGCMHGMPRGEAPRMKGGDSHEGSLRIKAKLEYERCHKHGPGQACVVTVTATPASGPRPCTVSVDKDVVVVKRTGSVDWDLTTSGYEFVGEGIKMENDADDFDPPPTSHPNPKKRSKKSNSNDLKVYKYSVLVQATSGADCKVLDPMMVNLD